MGRSLNLTRKTELGLSWSAAERLSNRGLQVIIQLLLARIMGPDEFGLLALTTIFVTLCLVIIDSGFSQAIVQIQDLKRIHVSSVFLFNILVAIATYTAIFIAAPFIAEFYKEPRLEFLIRVIGINFIIDAASRTHLAVLMRQLKFKHLFLIRTPALIVGGLIGLGMALTGFGVWSLVGQTFGISIATNVMIWSTRNDLFPQFGFCISALKQLANFGISILASALLFHGIQHLYGLIIGRVYSTAQLAFYNRARAFQQMPATTLAVMLERVMFPVLSQIQSNNSRIQRAFQSGIPSLSFVVFPLMVVLIVVAEPLIVTLLTDQWVTSAAYLQILPIIGMVQPLSAVNLSVVRAKGKSSLLFGSNVVKAALGIIVLMYTVRHGVMAIVIGQTAVALVGYFLNLAMTQLLIGYSVLSQLKATIPYLVVAATSSLACLPIPDNFTLPLIVLVCKASVYFLVFFLLSHMLRLAGYQDVCKKVTQLFGSRQTPTQ